MNIPIEILLATFAKHHSMDFKYVEKLWSECLIPERFLLETFLIENGVSISVDLLLGVICSINDNTNEPIECW